MREIRTHGSMSGSVETEHGMRLLRHERGNPDTELCRSLRHRATSRLYPLSKRVAAISAPVNRVVNVRSAGDGDTAGYSAITTV